MYNKLQRSFDSNLSSFYSWQRLANSSSNPHQKSDLVQAAIRAGKLKMIACVLLAEYDDCTRSEEAAEAVRWCEETAEAL